MKSYTRILSTIALFFSIIFLSVYLSYYPKPSRLSSDPLNVGIIVGYAPFAMLDDKAELEGFDISLAQEIAKRMGREIVFKDMSLSGLLIALEQNKIDLVLTGLSITAERAQKIAFVHYQGDPTTSFPLVFWQNIPEQVHSFSDFLKQPNLSICVEPGSIQEKFLLQYPDITVHQIHSMSDIVLHLKYGKATAALLDPDTFPSLKQKSPELTALLVPVPKAYQSNGIGIGINKTNLKLAQAVKSIVNSLKQDGTIAALECTWLSAQE